MPAIPPFILKKLYATGSLRNKDVGFALELRNTIAPGTIIAFAGLGVDGHTVELSQITLTVPNGDLREATGISDQAPLVFDLGSAVVLRVSGKTLEPGPHELTIRVVVQQVGLLEIPVSDELS